MYGCMDVWMYGCMDVWKSYGCVDVWMYRFMNEWIDRYLLFQPMYISHFLQIPGIPKHMSILHVEQEAVGDDTIAIQSVIIDISNLFLSIY